MSKHDIITSFFKKKAEKVLNFNFSPEEDGSISFITNYSDKNVASYVTGRKKKAYGFTMIITQQYSTYDDDANLKAMNFAQEFMDWIDHLNKTKDFPDLGDKLQVEEIEVLQNMPNLSGVNAQEGLARYMMQFNLLYNDDTDKI